MACDQQKLHLDALDAWHANKDSPLVTMEIEQVWLTSGIY